MRNDLRYAFRNMTRNPGVFAVALLTLALGIGANTAMFSVFYAALLKPIPVRDPARLTTILARIPSLNIESAFVEYNTFADWWRARGRSFKSMAAYVPATATLSAGGQPQRVKLLRVTANYFQVLGTAPAAGRDFLAEEDHPGARRMAILSNGVWKRRFSADPAVVGRPILLDKNSYTVAGILDPGFDLSPEDIFIPIAQTTARVPNEPSVGVYARLKAAVTIQGAQAEIDGLCREWVAQFDYPRDWGARVWPLQSYLVRNVRSIILLLAAAVGMVLLIACANVANLLLARAGARQREIAIRAALGAGRARIVQQLLTESALLGGMSAAAGVIAAWATVRIITAADLSLPFSGRISLNLPVLAFALGAALVTTVLFGIAPALSGSHTDLAANLKEGSQASGEGVRHHRLRGALVVAEVALALMLAIGAALTIRSMVRLQAVNPGFNAGSVLTAEITLPDSSYAEPGRRAAYFKTLRERVAALPSVQAAGLVSHLPFSGTKSGNDITIEGAPESRHSDKIIAFWRTVDPDYLRALQVPLLRGRFFTERDSAGPPVVIINETMARRCWRGQDPIGKRFGSGRRPNVWLTVVGMVGDMKSTSLAEEPDMEYFLPHGLMPSASMTLVVRTAIDPARLAQVLRLVLHELDPDVPLSDVVTLSAGIARSTGTRRVSVGLLGFFASLALLLAAVGVYGVISYSVARRTHEIGLRIALGLDRRGVAGLVLSQAMLLGGAGVVIGIAGSLALTRLIRSLLFGVSATDPATFASSSIFLLGVCALASWIPARRAAAVDPLTALRHE
ncbi:MAG: ABC transporter permease [Bryobacteraceae bacterium]